MSQQPDDRADRHQRRGDRLGVPACPQARRLAGHGDGDDPGDHRRRGRGVRGDGGRTHGVPGAPRTRAGRDPRQCPRPRGRQRAGRHRRRVERRDRPDPAQGRGGQARRASVVLPLLLPDSPVAVWWPADAPEDPAGDPLGALAQRRITDAAAPSGARPARSSASARRTPRATPTLPGPGSRRGARCWRPPSTSTRRRSRPPRSRRNGSARAPTCSSPGWSTGSGWTSRGTPRAARGSPRWCCTQRSGDVSISRADGKLASFSSPGQPDRPVALKRRSIPELLAEELRRLDEDDTYAAAARRLVKLGS